MIIRTRLAALVVTLGLLAAPAHAFINIGPGANDPSTEHSLFYGGVSVLLPFIAADEASRDGDAAALAASALAPVLIPAGSVVLVTAAVLWPGEQLLLTLQSEADGQMFRMVVPRSAVGNRDAAGLRLETTDVPEGKLLTLDQRVIGLAPNEAGVAALKRSALAR